MNIEDIERIKRYNSDLKRLKDEQNKVEAELRFNQAELKRLCDELSQELGISVNEGNIEQICEERKQKIMDTVTSGEAILARIKSGEVVSTQSNMVQQSSIPRTNTEQRTASFGFEEMDIAGGTDVAGTVDMGINQSAQGYNMHNSGGTININNLGTANTTSAQQTVKTQPKAAYGDVNKNDNSGIISGKPLNINDLPQMFNMPDAEVDSI